MATPLIQRPSGLYAPGATPAIAPAVLAPADRTREIVSSDVYPWLGAYIKSLPRWIDDATADLGYGLYEQMAKDATVRANLHTLKAGVLDDGMQLTCAVPDPDDDGHELASTILDFCNGVLEDLEPSIDHTLWDLCDAHHHGNRLAELVYRTQTIKGKPLLALSAVKVKPPETYAYALDAYNNLVGVLGLIPGVAFPVQYGQVLLDPKTTNLVPPEKFAIYTVRPRENDPRGTSILRAAYNAWWQKMQVWPEYLKYLTQFASPLIAAIMAATSAPVPARGIDGTIIPGQYADPAMLLLDALEQLRNGGVITLPNGTQLDIKQSQGDGSAFLRAFEYHDIQITLAITSQTLATGGHKNNTKAAASVHQDVLGTLVQQLKNMLVRVIRRQMLGRMVAYNWGDDAARALTPHVGLGQTEKPDQAGLLTALGTTPGWKIYPSQLPGVYELVGLPPADPDEIAADDAATQAAQQAALPPVPAPAPVPPVPAGEKPVPKPSPSKAA